MDHVQPVRHGQMEGFDHLHVEATEEAVKQRDDGCTITLVTRFQPFSSGRLTDQILGTRPGTALPITLRGAAENRRPEA